MASENGSHESPSDRVVRTLSAIERAYRDVVGRVRAYTPYVVRTAELLLAIALLGGLASWLYLFVLA